jgi:hypothetical protein
MSMSDPIAQYLADASAATRQAQRRDLKDNLNYLVSLVRSGKMYTPEQVMALGLPMPLIQTALLEASRVRNSPEFQQGQIAQQLFARQPTPPGSAPSHVTPWDLDGGAFQAPGYPAGTTTTREAQAFKAIAERFPTLFSAASNRSATDFGV